MGRGAVAYVTPARGRGAEADELRRVRRASGWRGFKVPSAIEVVDELPKTGTGKIQKFVLREWAEG